MNISHLFSNLSLRLRPYLKWIAWILAVGFYFYDFLLRVFPSVMVEALMLTFDIDAATIGEISGSYFYVYSFMQFPVGLLMDRYGARRLLSFATLLCGASALLFAFSPDVGVIYIARLLIAFGSAFAFVGLVYITSHWFPSYQRALLIGIGNSVGMFGGVAGEGPMSLVESWVGWRLTVVLLGIFGFLLAFLLIVVLHRGSHEYESNKKKSRTFYEAWKNLKKVLCSFQSWINAIISFFFYSTTAGFAGLWGVFFLEHNHSLSRNVAGFATSTIYIGWIIGGPILGYLSDRFLKRRPFLKICSLLSGLTLLPLILFTNLPPVLIFVLLCFVGIFSSAQLLTFSHAIELFSQKATGSAVAFVNFMVTIGGAIYQPLVGILLELFWSGTYSDGVQVYSHADYTFSTLCFPLSFFLAFILTFFMKERKQRRKPTSKPKPA